MALMGERESTFVDKLVHIGRVAKVVKGGRRFSFTAIVVVGDESGRVGWGSGKAREVPDAVRKATDQAKKAMVRVPLRENRTIHHDIAGVFGASRVFLKPATPGTGIIAGGPMRAVFEAMGMKDIVAKAHGSTNPYNLIQATFEAFDRLETPRAVAAKRGLKVADLRGRGAADDEERPADASAEAAPKPAPKKDTKPVAARAKAAPARSAEGARKPMAKKTDGAKAAAKPAKAKKSE
jgi:small subunit ribosomal protein S5